jgi:hypothetical protein
MVMARQLLKGWFWGAELRILRFAGPGYGPFDAEPV